MSSVNIHPKTIETYIAFSMMVKTPIAAPVKEMDEETARNIDMIHASIEALADDWRGERNVYIPDMPTERRDFWGVFAQAPNLELLPITKDFIRDSNGEGKTAIDLGCGSGVHTKELLKKGWKVIAVDSSMTALRILISQNRNEFSDGRLQVIESDMTSFTPEESVDLVIAADSLPYINPKKFKATWEKIHSYIKEGGYFFGSLFRLVYKPAQVPSINLMKEMGAWFLPDRRMVRPLLTSAGYAIQKCNFRATENQGVPVCIQFEAQKINLMLV